MATRATFRARVVDWLNRPDMTTAKANELIDMAQRRVEKECRLPTMEMSVDAEAEDLGTITIPYGFLEAQRIEADGVPVSLVTPERLLRLPQTAGNPAWAARIRGDIILRPIPQQYATLYYWGGFDALTADGDTNALLERDDTVLFYAFLSYAADYFRMDELTTWEARYVQERDDINNLAQEADLGPGPQSVLPSWGGEYT